MKWHPITPWQRIPILPNAIRDRFPRVPPENRFPTIPRENRHPRVPPSGRRNNMSVHRFVHDPQAKLDYGFTWRDWLGDDTITESTWTDDSGELTLTGASHTDGVTEVWVEGGRVGVDYKLTNRITTADGRKEDRTHILSVREK